MAQRTAMSHTQDLILSRVTEVDMGYRTPCWLSDRAPTRNGYTKIGIAGRTMLTHRVAYEEWVGPIAPGMQMDHLCRVRACCNPAHLEPVTPRENLMRGNTITAAQVSQTHCHAGHRLSGPNLYERPDRVGRCCRECRRLAAQRSRARRASNA